MKHLLFQSFFLLSLAALLAAVHGFIEGPPPAPGEGDPYALTFPEARAMEDALWVDARPIEAFDQGHYPGALQLYDDNWDEGLGEVLTRWSPGRVVIVYCDGAACEKSRSMALEFREDFGMENVYWLVGGYESLLEEGVIE